MVHERIAQAPERSAILKTYSKVLKGKPVPDQPQSPVHSALKLSGLVKTDEQGRLVARNRIYRRVFDARWIKSLRPSRWKRRAALGTLVLSAIVFGWWIGARQLTVRSGISVILAWPGIAYPEPEMVEIPAGRFRMGSPDSEEGRTEDEGPQHTVSVSRFALGRFEVTFDEYDVFALPGERRWRLYRRTRGHAAF
ncbi:MAG: formylglycine-generating enzyme family protein [Methylococcales bacterium]